MRNPNEGFVHWDMPELIWTGEAFQLQLSTTGSAYATNWLNVHLGDLLTKALGYKVSAEATPAHAAVSDHIVVRRGFEKFGVIAIHPLNEPLPDPAVLYNVISDAVAEAHKRAEEAETAAAKYISELRELGSPGQITE